MKKAIRTALMIAASASGLLLFQNCSQAFQADSAGDVGSEFQATLRQEQIFEDNLLAGDDGPVSRLLKTAAPAVNCQAAAAPSTFRILTSPVISKERLATVHSIAVDSAQDPGRIIDPIPEGPQDQNYAICDNLEAGINNRTSPSKLEKISTAADLMAALPETCAVNEVSNKCPAERLIVLPAGTFAIDKPLTLCSHCVLRGSVTGKTVIKSTRLNMNAMRISNGSRLEWLSVEGAWDGDDDSFADPKRMGAGVLINNVRNFAFINVGIRNHSTQGIASWNARYGCFWGVSLEKNGHRGINLSTFSHNLKLYRINGQNAHYAHVLFGHGSNNITLRNSNFVDTYATKSERASGAVGYAMLWLANDVHDVRVQNVNFKQVTRNPSVEPKGILIGNARDNKFENIQMDGLTYGVYMTSGRVDLPVPGLTNSDTSNNKFNNVTIRGNSSISASGAAIYTRTSRKFLVRSTCNLRHLVSGQEALVPVIRDNLFYSLTTSGYSTGVLSSPTTFAPRSIPTSAVTIADDSAALSRVRAPANESLGNSSGW